MIKVEIKKYNRLSQGDIYKDVEWIEAITESEGILTIEKINFPYVIVLTQECDLKFDYEYRWGKLKSTDNQDKYLISVLVAPIYNAEHVYVGEHLSKVGFKMTGVPRKGKSGDAFRQNKNPRYHYLEFPKETGIVESVIDFKHYFSVNVEYLKSIQKSHFVCRVGKLFREDISQRFASFLSRIGLPEIKRPKN